MQEFDCDLHFHGCYAMAVSKFMKINIIAEQAQKKGLHIVGTADTLHKKWFKEEIQPNLIEEENGVFKHKKFDTNFIIQTEIWCNDNIHYVVFWPDFQAMLSSREKLKKFSPMMDKIGGGRPRINLTAKQTAEIVIDSGGMIGAAHAFTPYFGIYGKYNSIQQAFGELTKKIHFLELGLSADTKMADKIEDHKNYAFLSNSDSHSPWPFRIGREFNRIKMKKPSFKELKKALMEREEKLITLNVGLNPKEGMYHCTACNACYSKYSLKDAKKLKWKCSCSGRIKKGVKDRIKELSSEKAKAPSIRPEYVHMLPLAEIIATAEKIKNLRAKKIQKIWKKFVDNFGTENKALIDASIEELKKVHEPTAERIEAFRKGYVIYIPGGGGTYGKPIICLTEKEFNQTKTKNLKEINC
jgi:uncharacterized protein (TIGR00375 family)